MRCRREGGAFRYSCRRGGEPATAELAWKPHGPVEPAQPDTLEHFLAERYVFFVADDAGKLLRGDVRHAPYPLQAAGLGTWDSLPVAWDGFGVRGSPVHAMASPGVSVRCWGLRPA